ncbi:hypothetical protein PsYK624_011200 [Phanerochaete sordida]|uniref:Uncharacterized protein n=1 Tax=Phanerochaete sordida TaxID=48140 RepID=A0A9P3FYR2_9APHY|nr:hypothetical protein PsYK624_011200 [Phanerochaete sordida]
MAGTSVCWLPVEVVDNILSVALAEHFDSLLFGPDAHARLPFCRVDAEESTDIGRRDVAESLFLVSRQFHHITLHILSAAFGVPFRERASNTFSRLDDIPWIQLVGLRTLRDLLSERPSVVREVRQGALVLTPQRGVCAGYHTLVLRQLNTTLNRRRLKIFPCINTLQEIQRSHPMCAAEVERGSDIPPLPEAFSNVLLRGFEQAYADEAIFYGYDVYAMELELQWKLFLCTVTAERRDNSDALAQVCHIRRLFDAQI